MANLFRSVPIIKPRKNFFDLSHEVKTSCRMGELIPFFCEPTVPGDKFKMQSQILVRLAPTLAPIMHRVNVYTHFFAVPYRLLWSEWEKFITEGVNGNLTPEYPTLQASACFSGPNSLACHLGFPVQNLPFTPGGSEIHNSKMSQDADFDALPFRAYQLIYDEYYRDQNLQAPLFKHISDRDGVPDGTSSPGIGIGSGRLQYIPGNNSTAWQLAELTAIRTRAWEKDYFTSALPFAQRGQDVSIGFGGRIPLKYTRDSTGFNGSNIEVTTSPTYDTWAPTTRGSVNLLGTTNGSAKLKLSVDQANSSSGANARLSLDNIYADGTDAATTITELRRGMKMQEFLEKNARGGSRYIESILSHFGVKSSDSRLQRPIYLGGGVSPIVISEVIQTAEDEQSPVGTMRGHAISAQVTHKFKHFFEEHCLILGIMSIMPKPAYMNGTPRKYLKRDVFDFYWPEFAHIGEQAIQEQEIFTDWSASSAGQVTPVDGDTGETDPNLSTFGYTPRFAEYKYIPSHVSGDMATNLKFWHMARDFEEAPNLNGNFVSSGITDRIFAVEDGTDNCWIQIYNKVHAKRPMPKFGIPHI